MRRAALVALLVALIAPAATPAHTARHRGYGTHQRKHAKRVRRDEPVRTTRKPHANRPTKPHRKHPHRRPPKPPVKPPVLPPPPKPKPLARVQVTAREYSLTLSRSALPAGLVSVELDNFGQDPHDLRVERADSPATGFSFTLAKPRTVSSQKFTLTPGNWKLYCTLPGHEALGMTALVTVSG